MKRYENKYFSILGDSISTLAGYSQPSEAVFYDTARKLASGVLTFSDTWWGQVIERLGGKLLVNNSISGSTVCNHPSYEIPSYGCSDERTSALDRQGISPDYIFVHLGTNDWGFGLRVNAEQTSGNYTFLTAYKAMLEKLQRNYPNAEIWCFTLPVSTCSAMQNFAFPYTYGGRHLSEYCNAIKESATAYGCRIIDLNETVKEYDTMDGFHPNVEGMQTLANAVLEIIQTNGFGE